MEHPSLMMLLVAVAVLSLLCKCLVDYTRRRRHLPPGPPGLPFLGYLPFLPTDFDPTIRRLFSRYGKIFSLRLGSTDVVFISDFDVMRKMSRLQVFSDRDDRMSDPDNSFPSSLCEVSGEEWKAQKQTSLRILRDMGNRRAFEDAILDELEDLMPQLEAHEKGNGVSVAPLLLSSALNITNFLILGSRLPPHDPERRVLESFVQQEEQRNMFHVFFMPSWLQSLLMPASSTPGDVGVDTVTAILKQKSSQLRQSPVPCFLTAYHNVMGRSGQVCDEGHMIGSTASLYTAGAQTVSEFVTWFLILMMIDPVIQQKVRQEVDLVVAKGRPSLTHRKAMPYTSAMMHELHRVAPVGPLALPHAVHQDVWLENYFLAKGTNFFYSLIDVCRNPDYFPDPDNFCPERFLSPDGSFVRNEKVCSFGLGKRSCPGESTANILSFLFITSLVQRFEMEAPTGRSYSMSGVCRFVSRLPAHAPIHVVFKKRL